MSLHVTTLYALLLIPIWMALFFRISASRAALQQSFGDGGSTVLLQKIRQHGNFIEWVPAILLLMLLAEAQRTDLLWVHAAGTLLVIGRLLHPFGLRADNPGHPLRYLGNGSNMLALAILVVSLLLVLLGQAGV